MHDPSATPPVAPHDRRGFFKKALALVLAGIAISAAVAPGFTLILDPLRRRRRRREAQFIAVTALAALPADGLPHHFAVLADRVDAWSTRTATSIGAVYLKRTSETDVVAFNVICPHLGCAVRSEADGSFICPCHGSEFDGNGRIVPITRRGAATVSPRDLDTLQVRLEGDRVWVRFENFQSARADKVPV